MSPTDFIRLRRVSTVQLWNIPTTLAPSSPPKVIDPAISMVIAQQVGQLPFGGLNDILVLVILKHAGFLTMVFLNEGRLAIDDNHA